jgi:hypothetical protein
MKLHPSLTLDPANTKRRERAAQFIEAARADLDALVHYIERANAEALRGDYWLEKVQDAELATKAALRATTCEGHARMAWNDRHGKG